ncbi:unnamed protein product [Lactuca saligna]|uniref:Uncharacterized protein n=1 Tax=Lactuca saligna TaxID=75948 RepID=A0AA36EPQ3_LACSI|nr:unnamed protein product [Lactuca saligna]
MQTVHIPSSEGLIVDDEPDDMSIFINSKPSTRTFSIDLDDYSHSHQKETQEHDDPQEDKFSSCPPDAPQDDAKKLKAKELKSKQEVLLKKKYSEILPEERSTWHDEQFRASSPKRTIFLNPDRGEDWTATQSEDQGYQAHKFAHTSFRPP